MTAIENTQQSLAAPGLTAMDAWSSLFDQRPMARAQAAMLAAAFRPVVILTELTGQTLLAMVMRLRALAELNSQPEPPVLEPRFTGA